MDTFQPNKIVILEDDQNHEGFLQSAAEETGHLVYMFDKETTFYNNFISIGPGLIIFRSASLNQVSRFLNTLLFLNFRRPILIFSDNAGMDDLVAGSQDLTVKVYAPPYQRSKIKATIDTAIHTPPIVPSNGQPIPIIVGNTPEMIRIKKIISGLGQNNDAILIQGEEGTGRELLAKSIHFASSKNEHAFIMVDVAKQIFENGRNNQNQTLTAKIITTRERTLLKDGGGTIYFKAIDTLPLSFQGSFLQFFHEDRIKGTRIIASSDLKIDQLVQKGLFRKDLYYRLNVIKMDIPTLRERKADIPLLVDFFVTKYCIESGVCHFNLSDEVKKVFSAYDWPNNIKELETFIARQALLDREDQIIDEIGEMIRKNKKRMEKGIKLKKITQRVVGRIETEILKLVLDKTNWNRRRAAETLTISYKSLLNKIKAYNLN